MASTRCNWTVAPDLLDAGATYVVVPDLLAGDELIEEFDAVAGEPVGRGPAL